MNQAYDWKCKLRNGNPNLVHLWYSLVTDSYTTGRMALSDESYFEKYPCLKIETMDKIEERINWSYTINFEPGTEDLISNSGQRLHNIFQVLLMTVSPSHRNQLYNIYIKFFAQRTSITRKLCSLWKLFYEGKTNQIMADFDQKNGSNRVAQILEEVTKYAKERNSDLTFEELVYRNIRNLISKENGESLYRLLKILQIE